MKGGIKSVRIVWKYLRKRRNKIIFISLFAVVGSCISAFIPFLYGRLVDVSLLEYASVRKIIYFLVFWLILSLTAKFINRFSEFSGYFMGVDVHRDFLLDVLNHVLDLPVNFHKKKRMGEVIRRADRGADALERIIDEVVFKMAPDFLTVVVALTIMFFVQWQLTVLLSFVLFLFLLITIWKTKNIVKAQRSLNKVYEKSFGYVYDAISNFQAVKSCANEKYEKERMSYWLRKRAATEEKGFMGLWKNLSAWQQTIFSGGFVCIFGVAVFLLRNHTISVGQLVMFTGYVDLAYGPFAGLADRYRRISTGLVSIKRANGLLKIKKEPYSAQSKDLKNVQGEVKFDHVDFGYMRQKDVLRDINIDVASGELVALVGESGVGKSTLLSLLSRYYIPRKGKIYIDGYDISRVSLESLRGCIAIVPQEVGLFNDTVLNNIRYGRLKASKEDVVDAAKAAYAHEFIQDFPKKYDQIVGERGIKLSTGQKQRIAIARAILRDPCILILDEATSSLDSATERMVQNALSNLIKGRTTFVIAHRLSTIRKADQILVLKGGKIIERGDHKELLERGGVYKNLCRLQSTTVR